MVKDSFVFTFFGIVFDFNEYYAWFVVITALVLIVRFLESWHF